jgi:hypothetical protein
MDYSDGDPLRVVATKMAPELLPLGERLMLPKESAMNSRVPKQMVSPREKPPQVRYSPSVVMSSVDD